MTNEEFSNKLDEVLEPLTKKDAFLGYSWYVKYVDLVVNRVFSKEEALKIAKKGVENYLEKDDKKIEEFLEQEFNKFDYNEEEENNWENHHAQITFYAPFSLNKEAEDIPESDYKGELDRLMNKDKLRTNTETSSDDNIEKAFFTALVISIFIALSYLMGF